MTTVVIKRLSDGSFVEVLPDGSTRPSVSTTDWSRLDAMTDAEVIAAALSDPDNSPLTDNDLLRMRKMPHARNLRRALQLTQEEFAARYDIPIGTLRDWEQGRVEPDQTA